MGRKNGKKNRVATKGNEYVNDSVNSTVKSPQQELFKTPAKSHSGFSTGVFGGGISVDDSLNQSEVVIPPNKPTAEPLTSQLKSARGDFAEQYKSGEIFVPSAADMAADYIGNEDNGGGVQTRRSRFELASGEGFDEPPPQPAPRSRRNSVSAFQHGREVIMDRLASNGNIERFGSSQNVLRSRGNSVAENLHHRDEILASNENVNRFGGSQNVLRSRGNSVADNLHDENIRFEEASGRPGSIYSHKSVNNLAASNPYLVPQSNRSRSASGRSSNNVFEDDIGTGYVNEANAGRIRSNSVMSNRSNLNYNTALDISQTNVRRSRHSVYGLSTEDLDPEPPTIRPESRTASYLSNKSGFHGTDLERSSRSRTVSARSSQAHEIHNDFGRDVVIEGGDYDKEKDNTAESENVRSIHPDKLSQHRLSKLSIHTNNDEFVLVGGHPPIVDGMASLQSRRSTHADDSRNGTWRSMTASRNSLHSMGGEMTEKEAATLRSDASGPHSLYSGQFDRHEGGVFDEHPELDIDVADRLQYAQSVPKLMINGESYVDIDTLKSRDDISIPLNRQEFGGSNRSISADRTSRRASQASLNAAQAADMMYGGSNGNVFTFDDVHMQNGGSQRSLSERMSRATSRGSVGSTNTDDRLRLAYEHSRNLEEENSIPTLQSRATSQANVAGGDFPGNDYADRCFSSSDLRTAISHGNLSERSHHSHNRPSSVASNISAANDRVVFSEMPELYSHPDDVFGDDVEGEPFRPTAEHQHTPMSNRPRSRFSEGAGDRADSDYVNSMKVYDNSTQMTVQIPMSRTTSMATSVDGRSRQPSMTTQTEQVPRALVTTSALTPQPVKRRSFFSSENLKTETPQTALQVREPKSIQKPVKTAEIAIQTGDTIRLRQGQWDPQALTEEFVQKQEAATAQRSTEQQQQQQQENPVTRAEMLLSPRRGLSRPMMNNSFERSGHPAASVLNNMLQGRLDRDRDGLDLSGGGLPSSASNSSHQVTMVSSSQHTLVNKWPSTQPANYDENLNEMKKTGSKFAGAQKVLPTTTNQPQYSPNSNYEQTKDQSQSSYTTTPMRPSPTLAGKPKTWRERLEQGVSNAGDASVNNIQAARQNPYYAAKSEEERNYELGRQQYQWESSKKNLPANPDQNQPKTIDARWVEGKKGGDTVRRHVPRGRIRDLASQFDTMELASKHEEDDMTRKRDSSRPSSANRWKSPTPDISDRSLRNQAQEKSRETQRNESSVRTGGAFDESSMIDHHANLYHQSAMSMTSPRSDYNARKSSSATDAHLGFSQQPSSYRYGISGVDSARNRRSFDERSASSRDAAEQRTSTPVDENREQGLASAFPRLPSIRDYQKTKQQRATKHFFDDGEPEINGHGVNPVSPMKQSALEPHKFFRPPPNYAQDYNKPKPQLYDQQPSVDYSHKPQNVYKYEPSVVKSKTPQPFEVPVRYNEQPTVPTLHFDEPKPTANVNYGKGVDIPINYPQSKQQEYSKAYEPTGRSVEIPINFVSNEPNKPQQTFGRTVEIPINYSQHKEQVPSAQKYGRPVDVPHNYEQQRSFGEPISIPVNYASKTPQKPFTNQTSSPKFSLRPPPIGKKPVETPIGSSTPKATGVAGKAQPAVVRSLAHNFEHETFEKSSYQRRSKSALPAEGRGEDDFRQMMNEKRNEFEKRFRGYDDLLSHPAFAQRQQQYRQPEVNIPQHRAPSPPVTPQNKAPNIQFSSPVKKSPLIQRSATQYEPQYQTHYQQQHPNAASRFSRFDATRKSYAGPQKAQRSTSAFAARHLIPSRPLATSPDMMFYDEVKPTSPPAYSTKSSRSTGKLEDDRASRSSGAGISDGKWSDKFSYERLNGGTATNRTEEESSIRGKIDRMFDFGEHEDRTLKTGASTIDSRRSRYEKHTPTTKLRVPVDQKRVYEEKGEWERVLYKDGKTTTTRETYEKYGDGEGKRDVFERKFDGRLASDDLPSIHGDVKSPFKYGRRISEDLHLPTSRLASDDFLDDFDLGKEEKLSGGGDLAYSLSQYREMQREYRGKTSASNSGATIEEPKFFRSPSISAQHAGQRLSAYRARDVMDVLGESTVGEKIAGESRLSRQPTALATSTPLDSPHSRIDRSDIGAGDTLRDLNDNDTFLSSISGVSAVEIISDVRKKIDRLNYMIENTKKQKTLNEMVLHDAQKKGRVHQELAAHRSLLLGREQLRLQVDELRRLHALTAVRRPPPPLAHVLRGSAYFSDITLQLNKNFCKNSRKTDKESSYAFLVLMKCGHEVEASEYLTPDVDNEGDIAEQVRFGKTMRFDELPVDFSVTLEVYAMRIPESKPHASELSYTSSLASKCKSLIGPPQKKAPAVPVESGFRLRGQMILDRDACGSRCFYLDDVIYPLEGTIKVTTKCSQLPDAIEVDYRGFLTMYSTAGTLASWERYWAVLRRGVVFFWKYPDEEQMEKCPLLQMDLTKCTTRNVEKCAPDLCPRPHSFSIEMIVSLGHTIVERKRVLLSADSSELLNQWLVAINDTLNVIRG